MKFIKFLSLCTACICGSLHSSEQPPNILLFLVDDLGVRDIACYGSTFYESPAIDELAAEGRRYTQAYAAHPRCVPSRYGIFTGRFPARDGCPGDRYEIAPDTVTMAEALREAGYRTFYAGKWHLGKQPSEMPDAQGFDINIAGGAAGAPRSFFAPYNESNNPHHKAALIEGLEDAPEGEYLNDRLTEETLIFLRNHARQRSARPFFAVLSHYAVHTPLEAKADDIEHFSQTLSTETEEQFMQRDGSTKVEQDNPTYAAMIRSTDESLSKVMEALKDLNLYENTIVIFTSDHGGLSNRGFNSQRQLATSNLPFRAGKGHLYEGGIRVPFIASWPDMIEPGRTSESIVTGSDLYATFVEIAGLQPRPSDHIDSVSLLREFQGEDFQREAILWHSPRPRPTSTGDSAASAIREGDYKLIKFYFPEVHYELYDIASDPGENRDISEEHPELRERLIESLDTLLEETNAIAVKPGN